MKSSPGRRNVGGMTDPRWAESIAESLLREPLPRRWAHTQGVARRARELAPLLGDETQLVEAAAWLHDIGYSPAVENIGFHPLDGARYLRDQTEADEEICRLVAHHTGASIEAEERRLPPYSDEFPPPRSRLLEALTYCDMTSAVDGELVDIDQRLEEILIRYPAEHVVHRSITRSSPQLRAATLGTAERLRRAESYG
jgi:putative nucleotidyltransferase with HDIG domain